MSRSESAPASGDGIAPDRRTLGTAAVGGVLSYLVAYAITYAVTGQQIANSLAARVLEIATGEPGTWKLVGWVFYSAHYVTSEIPGLFGSTAVNLVGRGDTFPAALFLLPPVLLLVAGAVTALLLASVLGTVFLAITVTYLLWPLLPTPPYQSDHSFVEHFLAFTLDPYVLFQFGLFQFGFVTSILRYLPGAGMLRDREDTRR